jgi:hypothetical protein
MKEQMQKTYGSAFFAQSAYRKFRKDAEKLSVDGWFVQSQSYAYSYFATPNRHHIVSVVYERNVKEHG